MKLRKSLVTSTLLVLIMVCFLAGTVSAAIRVGTPTDVASTRYAELVDEFTEETGIKVNFEQMLWPDLQDKIKIESVGQTGYYDIIRIGTGGQKKYTEPGWIVPLNDFIEESDFDIDDFVDSTIGAASDQEGNIWYLPYAANVMVLGYRTDLFEDPDEKAAFEDEYGYELAPPDTTEEWLDTAEFFTRPEEDLYGFGIGQRVPEHIFWPMYMGWTFGSELFDDQNIESKFNNEKTATAFEWMLEMQENQPPGILGVNYKEEELLYRRGELAMAPIFFTMAMDVLDPEESEVHDKTAFTTIPRYPESGYETGQMHIGGGGFAIHAHSDNKDEAWTFLSWLLGKEVAHRVAYQGTVNPRNSLMENDNLLEEVPEYQKIFPAYQKQLQYGGRLRPAIAEAPAIMEQWGHAWHAVVQDDKSIEKALADAEKNINDILEEAGY